MTNATTIKVQFTDPAAAAASNAHLSAEIDARPDGLNGGKTTFEPGSTAYVLIYKSANVALLTPEASAGSFGYSGTASVSITYELQFANTRTATLNVPADSVTSYKWLGRDLGLPVLGSDKQTITVPSAGVGVLSMTYNATATIGALSSPTSLDGESSFSILVLIQGEAS